jgi:hypothetical protein
MDYSERLREQWSLPQDILDQQGDAIAAEVWWHIFDVFGYETGVLKPEECGILYHRFCHEDAHSDHGLRRISACNAFAWFVNAFGGPAKFGMTPSQIAEWRPTQEPFDVLDFEVE